MSNAPNELFGIHTRALALWQQRAEVLANNLANADTPNFHARDIDFRAALGAASGNAGLAMTTTAAGHRTTAGPAGEQGLMYRVPTQPSLDGNSVDAQVEQAAFAENSVRYQASLAFISGQIRSLRTAITGS
ncbi:MAG TPA: flagellar basal body rod protein FlgB [Dokdonella sp.]|jgi:flagellar basal-body rod protein FlgB|nr:flagellar basal body rod protein FlgB [Dokdonella sp.]